MVSTRIIARSGVVLTAGLLFAFMAIIAIGSAKFSVSDLRTHGTASLASHAALAHDLAGTLAVASHR